MNIREKMVFAVGDLLQPGFSRMVLHKDSGLAEGESFGKFCAICEYARDNFDFYRIRYESRSFSLKDIRRESDIAALPCIDKQQIRQYGGISSGRRAFVSLESGGTASGSFSTHLNGSYLLKRYGMLLAILYGLGWRMGGRISALHPIEYGYFNNLASMMKMGKFNKAAFEFTQQYLLYYLFHNRRNIYYGGSVFEEDLSESYYRRLLEGSPVLIISRPDVLNVIAKQSRAAVRTPCNIKKSLVVGNIATASGLKRMEELTGGRVYNMYASTEAGYVGLSCSASAEYVHIDEGNYYVELDRDDCGEVLVTDFNNTSMPMIRYRTGDIGEFFDGKCACGNSSRLLKIKGRKGKFLLTRSGARIYESDILEFFEGFPLIWGLQFKRELDSYVRVLVRPREIDRRYLEKALSSFRERFGFAEESLVCDLDSPFYTSSSGKFCSII